MKPVKFFLVIITAAVFAGCAPGGGGPRTLLTVDFQKDQTLKYKFTSVRKISIDWSQGHELMAGGGRVNSFLDSMNLVISYTPVNIDPYGVSTIKAVCEQASVRHDTPRSERSSQNDAAQNFSGKNWTFTMDATGRILDDSAMLEVVREVGKKAFRTDTGRGLIKEPDMIYDFIASQWFLWDSISSIKKPLEGVRIGQRWKSKLSIPSSMFLFTGRDVNYMLAEIRQEPNKGRVAVINSSYSPFYPTPSEWPLPYTEVFQLSGTFGFLRDYKVLDINGSGQEFFNVDEGRIEHSNQNWTMNVVASLPLNIGPQPKITIKQTLTMELVAISAKKTDPAPEKKTGQ